MIISSETNVLETNGTMNARRSTIKTSKKTFRMVVDGIYSDKIGSIVREIAANAWDSHKRAGQTEPFFVHCPTALRPEFFVRDKGVGMTDELMESVYIVVGESDKGMTNDEVGTWGLGSKAPFAYADQYFISCYDGAEVRHYGYGIAEDGVPTLFLMEVEPCDEPRGVRVGFSVEAADHEKFRKAIEQISIGHSGAFESNIPLKTMGERSYGGEDWEARTGGDLGLQHTSGWYVRQGCILYPIDPAQVPNVPSRYGSYSTSTTTYILDCPIGSVNITTSREAISYDEDVVKYLASRIDAVKQEIRDAIWEQVKSIKNVAAFFKKVEELKPSFLESKFTHPITGLESPKLLADGDLRIFSFAREFGDRWTIKPMTSIALAELNQKLSRFFLIDDISALYDPSRTKDDPAGFSHSEVRRITRFTRAYLESNKLDGGIFFYNANWSQDFYEACFGEDEFTSVTFDDLRKAVPRRIVPPKSEQKAPIRGLALAKGAGEQRPVFEVDPPGGASKCAWVSSDEYRRHPNDLFRAAKHFEIDNLYICAPKVEEQVEQAGVMHLSKHLEGLFSAAGATFEQWYYARKRGEDYVSKEIIAFLRSLYNADPETYKKLASAKGEFSTIALHLEPLLQIDTGTIDNTLLKAIRSICYGSSEPPTPTEYEMLESTLKAVRNNVYSNPTCAFVNAVRANASKEQLVRAAKALIQIQKLIPPSEKFNG